jgi:hypothetical protein
VFKTIIMFIVIHDHLKYLFTLTLTSAQLTTILIIILSTGLEKTHFIDVTTPLSRSMGEEQPHWYPILSHKYYFNVFKSVLFQVTEATTLT